MPNLLILNLGFHYCDGFDLVIEVKLPLLEHKDVQDLSTLQFLFVQISYSINSLLSLPFFDHIHVTGVLKVRFDRAGKGAILDEGLTFFGPVAKDVSEG